MARILGPTLLSHQWDQDFRFIRLSVVTSGLKWTHFPAVFGPALLIIFVPRLTRLTMPFQQVMELPKATEVGPFLSSGGSTFDRR